MLKAVTPRTRALLALPFALALIAGCSGSSDPTSATTAAPSADKLPRHPRQDTPAARGRHAAERPRRWPRPSRSSTPGKNRFGFGVFTVDHGNVPDADVAIYAAKPNGKAEGPYPATIHSLATPPAFAAKTTTQDPDAAKYVYTTDVDLPANGDGRSWR